MSNLLPPLPQPDGDTWTLPGNPRPPSTIVKPNSVLAALLACLESHPEGASLAMCEVAVQRAVMEQKLKGKHPVIPLMCWAAPNRGIEFTCRAGLVTYRPPATGIKEL